MTIPRALHTSELKVLRVLLAVDFPGAEALRGQVPGLTVTGSCSCGCPSVHLKPATGAPAAEVATRVPVDATALSTSGEPDGLVLLFVDDGRLSYLEYAPLADNTAKVFPPPAQLGDVAAADITSDDEAVQPEA